MERRQGLGLRRAGWPLIGAVALVVASMFATATPVVATSPDPVTITVDTTVDGGDPFVATGGVVCNSGIVSTTFRMFSGNERTGGLQLLLVKRFECSDGTFDLLLRVSLEFATGTTGNWSVVGGSGAYERLHGTGSVTGTYGPDDTIHDVYVGTMAVR